MAFPEYRNSIHICSIDFVQVLVLGFHVVSVNAQENMAFPEQRNSTHIRSVDRVRVDVTGFVVLRLRHKQHGFSQTHEQYAYTFMSNKIDSVQLDVMDFFYVAV